MMIMIMTMMMSISPFGPVGCGRPLRGADKMGHGQLGLGFRL
jgi:hypothetical protein